MFFFSHRPDEESCAKDLGAESYGESAEVFLVGGNKVRSGEAIGEHCRKGEVS